MAEIFNAQFAALTDYPPLPWQIRLFNRLLNAKPPRRCDLPTGFGKSSVIVIWLLALAHQRAASVLKLPRRLVYIVDRRTIVDQATRQADRIRNRLFPTSGESVDPSLNEIISALHSLNGSIAGQPLAISTLRGELADNHEWRGNPARPAIIIGTIDKIGSNLLFAGYGGIGRYHRSLQAGLLAQDVFVVVDEAHLCPAFVQTLTRIRGAVHRTAAVRPFELMFLSATLGPAQSLQPEETTHDTFEVEPQEDLKNEELARRYYAPKSLELHLLSPTTASAKTSLAERLAASAASFGATKSAVVVFTTKVNDVHLVVAALKTTHGIPEKHIEEITGELRGAERDALYEKNDTVFANFRKRHRDRGDLPHSIFLVATSAAEVGLDFDADHAACDLTSLERLIQRVGRVNRFGDSGAKIHVHAENQPEDDPPKKATYELLQRLPESGDGFDVSPAALSKLPGFGDAYLEACSPPPPCPPLSDALLDDWSFTTLRPNDYPRPQVTWWLRGLVSDETAQTSIGWRADLNDCSVDDLAKLAAVIPVKSRELAPVATYRAVEFIAKLAARAPTIAVALLDQRNIWSACTLGQIAANKDALFRTLAHSTVLLPSNAGGLTSTGSVDASSTTWVEDCVDEKARDARPAARMWARFVVHHSPGKVEASHLHANGTQTPIAAPFNSVQKFASWVAQQPENRRARRHLVRFYNEEPPEFSETESSEIDDAVIESPVVFKRVEYFALEENDQEDGDLAALCGANVDLESHNTAVRDFAEKLVRAISLPTDLAEAVVLASANHDLGKNRLCWQQAIGNPPEARPLAKSECAYFDRSASAGYRHEFGSMLEAAEIPAIKSHSRRELILHLIAAHHGYARPGFRSQAYDPAAPIGVCEAAADAAERRFIKLQHEFGWWQLAYLEALVKCADGLASASIPEVTP